VSEKFLRPDEIARQLDVKEETVRNWIRRKLLPAYKLGNEWRVSPEDYQEFLRQRRTVGENQETP
jgi:excisionase family DNA binding protein